MRGTVATGEPAQTLTWRYRVNGGQAAPYNGAPESTVRYDDEAVTATGGTLLTRSVHGTFSPTSATGSSGSTTYVSTDHLSADSPATILQRDVDSRTMLTIAGLSSSSQAMFDYAFAATPMSTFFDREDLDVLALGFSESQQVGATATGSISTTDSSGPQSQPVSTTLTLNQSWTLRAQLPSFEVLGHGYANVVQVESATRVEVVGATAMQQTASTIWLAKGIGMIRGEDTLGQAGTTNTITYDLVETNLVAP